MGLLSDPAPSGGDSEGEESGPSRDPVPAVSSENHLRAFIKKWLEEKWLEENAEATMDDIGECQAKYKEEQKDEALWEQDQNVRLGVLYKEALAARAQMLSSPVVHARKLVEVHEAGAVAQSLSSPVPKACPAEPSSTKKPSATAKKLERPDDMAPAEAFCLKAWTLLLGPDDDFVGISVRKRFPDEDQGVWTDFQGIVRRKWKAKGEVLFHVEYSDGDDEDMGRSDITQLLMQVWVGVRAHHCLLVGYYTHAALLITTCVSIV